MAYKWKYNLRLVKKEVYLHEIREGDYLLTLSGMILLVKNVNRTFLHGHIRSLDGIMFCNDGRIFDKNFCTAPYDDADRMIRRIIWRLEIKIGD